MWTYEHTVDTRAGAGAVFALFSDVTSWPEWNAGVERVELDGPFQEGATGTMHMPGGESLAFRLSWVEEDGGFEDETPVPDAGVVVRVRHELLPSPAGGTRIRYRCVIDGPSVDEAGPAVGAMVTGDFADVMAALSARAEAADAG